MGALYSAAMSFFNIGGMRLTDSLRYGRQLLPAVMFLLACSVFLAISILLGWHVFLVATGGCGMAGICPLPAGAEGVDWALMAGLFTAGLMSGRLLRRADSLKAAKCAHACCAGQGSIDAMSSYIERQVGWAGVGTCRRT